jgi:hypothetical protein
MRPVEPAKRCPFQFGWAGSGSDVGSGSFRTCSFVSPGQSRGPPAVTNVRPPYRPITCAVQGPRQTICCTEGRSKPLAMWLSPTAANSCWSGWLTVAAAATATGSHGELAKSAATVNSIIGPGDQSEPRKYTRLRSVFHPLRTLARPAKVCGEAP